MNPVAILALIDGLLSLTFRLVQAVRTDPSTPEELAKRLATVEVALADTHHLVMDWRPVA